MASGSEMRQRTKMLGVRLTKEEFAKLTLLANEAGTSAPAFLRAAALAGPTSHVPRRSPASHEALSRILDRYEVIGNDINEIAKRLNSGGGFDPEELRKALVALLEVFDLTRSALAGNPDGSPSQEFQGRIPRGP